MGGAGVGSCPAPGAYPAARDLGRPAPRHPSVSSSSVRAPPMARKMLSLLPPLLLAAAGLTGLLLLCIPTRDIQEPPALKVHAPAPSAVWGGAGPGRKVRNPRRARLRRSDYPRPPSALRSRPGKVESRPACSALGRQGRVGPHEFLSRPGLSGGGASGATLSWRQKSRELLRSRSLSWVRPRGCLSALAGAALVPRGALARLRTRRDPGPREPFPPPSGPDSTGAALEGERAGWVGGGVWGAEPAGPKGVGVGWARPGAASRSPFGSLNHLLDLRGWGEVWCVCLGALSPKSPGWEFAGVGAL